MLTIHNNPDGTIADTDYWQSEYNTRDLAYLSGHNLALRLLLPTSAATLWLPEIKTGKRVLIEPAVRQGYNNHIDLVFDDGTDTPFSLCLDKDRQLDRSLRSGQTKLLIYTDGQTRPLALPCIIELPDAPRELAVTHITVNTGHSRRSYRREVQDEVIGLLQNWLPDLYAGQLRAIIEDKYAVRCDWHNGKSAGFTVQRLDNEMNGVDLVKISVCRHSKKAAAAWQFVDGQAAPPPVPFVAATMLTDNATPADLSHIGMIADFERTLAWAWLESH